MFGEGYEPNELLPVIHLFAQWKGPLEHHHAVSLWLGIPGTQNQTNGSMSLELPSIICLELDDGKN